ncbi:IPT/TIG domain-containing protein [Streptomyces sparsogenes]|uniref:IPT/TIG domain-containing protein n=1 Tax=Streptomyces sparsogenes TaxID=67365 RepID=UPI0033EACB27
MGDYSKSPEALLRENRGKGYVGIHVEQGVPILDRDLNLLQDLLAATVREVFTRYIGNGTAQGDDGFRIEALPAQDAGVQAAENDFRITPGTADAGTCLVSGVEVRITEPITYKGQGLGKDLTTPTEDRKDLVYLDVTLVEEDANVYAELLNSDDVGVQTSVRIKPTWAVRVHEGHTTVPDPPEDGHAFHSLALLTRPKGKKIIEPSDIEDLRTRRLTVSDLESRLSRLEQMVAVPAFTPDIAAEFMPRSGAVGQAIVINGKRFDVGTVEVLFGDQRAPIVTGPSANKLVALVPETLALEGAPRTVRVSVRNEFGTATAGPMFTVTLQPAFDDQQFEPRRGVPNTLVFLSGFNFAVGTPRVFFNGKEAGTVSISSRHIEAKVPAGLVPAGEDSIAVRISVRTEAGEATSNDLFLAELPVPRPTFSSMTPFSPVKGKAGQVVVQLNGANFNIGTPKVFFGPKKAEPELPATATLISVRVPADLPAGPVDIKVQTDGGEVTSPTKFLVEA